MVEDVRYAYTDAELRAAIAADVRVERFRFFLLDASLRAKGELYGVTALSLSHSMEADVMTSGSIEGAILEVETGDFLVSLEEIANDSDRLGIYYDIQMPDGFWARWPMGVFLMKGEKKKTAGDVVTRSFELFDLGYLLTLTGPTEATLDADPSSGFMYFIASGTSVTTEVASELTQAQIPSQALDNSSETLSASRSYSLGTDFRTVIGELLDTIGFEPLYFDRNGVACSAKVVVPADKTVLWTYDGNLSPQSAIRLPEAEVTFALSEVPNRWVATCQNSGINFLSMFTNSSPTSPTSTVARGYSKTSWVTDIEATSQDVLDQKVRDRAHSDSQVYQTIDFSTLINPYHWHGDVVLFYDELVAPMLDRYEEREWSFDWAPNQATIMTHKMRKVVNVDA